MPTETEELGIAVAVLRAEERWPQKRLAAAAGISRSYLSELEGGKANLTRPLAEKLVALLGLPAAKSLDRALCYGRAHRAEVEAYRLAGAVGSAGAEDLRAAVEGATELWRDFTAKLGEQMLGHFEIAAARRLAPSQWARLASRSPAERRERVDRFAEFQTFALCEVVCEQSVEAAARHPDEALELAELALRIAQHVPGEPAFRSRMTAYAWAFVGNARRLRDLRAGEEAFQKFDELWAAGEGSSKILSESRVLSLKASLRCEQGRHREATSLLDRAFELSRGEAERARTLIKKAKVLEEQGEHLEAIQLLERAKQHLDPQRHPRLAYVQLFNYTVCLVYAERYGLAAEYLSEVRELTGRLGREMDLVKVQWMTGHINAGLGRIEEGLAILKQVKAELARRELPLLVAVVVLEMAAFLASLGRHKDVKALAMQAAAIAKSQQLQRPVITALQLFCQAAEQEKVTKELARTLVRQVRLAESNQTESRAGAELC